MSGTIGLGLDTTSFRHFNSDTLVWHLTSHATYCEKSRLNGAERRGQERTREKRYIRRFRVIYDVSLLATCYLQTPGKELLLTASYSTRHETALEWNGMGMSPALKRSILHPR